MALVLRELHSRFSSYSRHQQRQGIGNDPEFYGQRAGRLAIHLRQGWGMIDRFAEEPFRPEESHSWG